MQPPIEHHSPRFGNPHPCLSQAITPASAHRQKCSDTPGVHTYSEKTIHRFTYTPGPVLTHR